MGDDRHLTGFYCSNHQVFFGFYPTKKASELHPINALMYE